MRFTEAAKAILAHYHWPGNVRELSNLVERMAILAPYGLVDVTDLPAKYRGSGGISSFTPAVPSPEPAVLTPSLVLSQAIVDNPLPALVPQLPAEGVDLKVLLSNLESSLIRQALERNAGVVAHAATFLKMRRTTLVEKCRKYGLQRQMDESSI